MSGFPDLETIGLRLLAIVGALAAWFATQRMIGERQFEEGTLYDHLHVVTAECNAWLNAHPRAANVILVASSLCVDVVTLFVLAYAVLGPSFMPFWGLLGLFVLRQVTQAAIALPAPPGIIWRDPGVPSLFVTYGVGNDFYFSGHTALAVYGAIVLASLHIPLLTVLGAIVAAGQVVAVIVLRAHWTMDVVAGLLAAIAAGPGVNAKTSCHQDPTCIRLGRRADVRFYSTIEPGSSLIIGRCVARHARSSTSIGRVSFHAAV